MKVVETVGDLRKTLAEYPRLIGLVPTMGYLHQGHLSLVRRCRADCATVAVSIFVNPTQFGPDEDYQRYPRDVPGDLSLCENAGVDVVFAPTVEQMYPPGDSTLIEVQGLQDRWEGEVRPGHFRGVATVVAKLLRMVCSERAYFGEKDFQQLQVVRRMVRDLVLDVEIVGCPTVRDEDGLALSSRNAYLSADERQRALALSRALQTAQQMVAGGEQHGVKLTAMMRSIVAQTGALQLDYAAVVDPGTLEPVEVLSQEARALIAARVGTTRLIDNAALVPPAE